MTETTQLSGYRIMWMLTMFDLPVLTDFERKEATRFRNVLMELGFERTQLSVYMRFVASREQKDSLLRKIRRQLPPGGEVAIMFLTDKQFEQTVSFHGGKRRKVREKPAQYTLF